MTHIFSFMAFYLAATWNSKCHLWTWAFSPNISKAVMFIAVSSFTVVSYLQESVPDPSTATRILASMRRVRIGRAMRPDRPVRPASGLVGSLRLGTSWVDQASQGLISLGSLITGLKWS